VPDSNNPSELDAKTFGGKAMTYYGRWTYKYEIGAQKGAAGVLIVHETGPAGYGFNVIQGKTGEQFDLVTPDKNMSRVAVEGWITLDQTKALLQLRGAGLRRVEKRRPPRASSKPVPLGVTASMTIKNSLRTIASAQRRREARRIRSEAEGRVRRLHGALGPFRQERGRYLHGAEDDALGCAALHRGGTGVHQAADAAAALDPVSGGDGRGTGLLGSQYYS
jgi:hypothetical protein